MAMASETSIRNVSSHKRMRRLCWVQIQGVLALVAQLPNAERVREVLLVLGILRFSRKQSNLVPAAIIKTQQAE